MDLFLSSLGISSAVLIIGIIIYLLTPRRYQSSDTVANSYDESTEDGIFRILLG